MSPFLLLLVFGFVAPSLAGVLPFIVNGRPVDSATKYPWQGSLQRYGSHSCGAALIASNWALTAAHCVDGSASRTLTFGTIMWRFGGVKVSVTETFIHPLWRIGAGSFPNDIALLSFPAVDFSSTVQAITLASEDQAGNDDCHISGWGATRGGGSIPSQLQEANVAVYTHAECVQAMGSRSINEGHVCVGGPKTNNGACNGDSGGPLACYVGLEPRLVGLTSFGRVYCPTSKPSVYTRVTYFKDWVKDTIGDA